MWSLYNEDKFLEPLSFSNGKTQADVVKEILDNIEKGHKIIFIHGVCGTGKCLEKDSLIFCKPSEEPYFGYYPISGLEGKEGEIVSLNDKGEIIPSKFNNVRKTGIKKIYSIRTRTGREILASVNHPFLTITEKGIEWKKVEELTDKDYVCLPNKISLEKDYFLEDEKIKILAHLIAEGKLGDKAGSPKYYQDKDQNTRIRADYESALKKLFPDGEIRNNHQTEVTIVFNNKNTRFGTTNKLRLFIREFGLDGKKSKDKFVPRIIFNLNEEKIALFLRTLFSGDGCIYSRKIKNKNEEFIIEYSSISKRLIGDVSLLLNRIGISHTITSKKFRDNLSYCYRMTISNQNQIKKFIETIGFIGEKQETALEILSKLKVHKFTNIDKVPRIIREYLKNKGYTYTQLDRFLNYDEIIERRKEKSFKEIRKDKTIRTPCVFKQSKIDFLRNHIKKINHYIKDDNLGFICHEDIIWDKIKQIKYVKEDETYDLEVPEFHNFISDGIIVHNSAIALNLARKLGKTSIVVPGKNLQNQYKKDYEDKKYLLKDSMLNEIDTEVYPRLKNLAEKKERLKISVITGRKNHKCKFLEENERAIPRIKKEVNSNLNDIFEFSEEELAQKKKMDKSAEVWDLPCKIEIKEKNWRKLKEYIKQNKRVNPEYFNEIKDVTRASVAGACPYWSPVLPAKFEIKHFPDSKKRIYEGLNKTNFIIHQGKPGCKFYEQFNSYLDSDVMVFNSSKYILESALNRKPSTEVEIIDECDEFLDKFSNQRSINLDRLQNALVYATGFSESFNKAIGELSEVLKQLKQEECVLDAINSDKITLLKKTGIYDILKVFLSMPEFLEEIDDENYLFEIEETARMFEGFLDESYVTFAKKENQIIASIVTTNLAKRFKEMVDKNKKIILMSGTLHSEYVLKNIFGMKDFKIIEAETKPQGRIEAFRTGAELDCRYSSFASGKSSRKEYLKSLSKCIEVAKKPILVHINAFTDLPSEKELQEYEIDNLISREKLRDLQIEDNEGKLVDMFKKGESSVLFSTRASRGIDFPGEECNSIVFTKYPNPNIQDAFWKILNQTRPQDYWEFYKDKARRELWQKVYRGVRSKDDHVYVLSPDIRVLEAFEKGE